MKPKSHVLSTRFVHFFGPDGAGKSVQAEVLVKVLNQKGFKTRKLWLRAHHTIAFVLWKMLILIGFYRAVPSPNGIRKIPAVHHDRFLRLFWSIVEFVSVLPILLRIRLLLLRGYMLVAERYILDTITAVSFVLRDHEFGRSWVSRTLLRFIPSNTVFIFLDADYETLRQRKVQSNSLEESRDYINFQRSMYEAFAIGFDALKIDTSKTSIEETSRIILHYLISSSKFP